MLKFKKSKIYIFSDRETRKSKWNITSITLNSILNSMKVYLPFLKSLICKMLFISLFFYATDSHAQTRDVKFIQVTGTNGVSLGKINSIVQDKYGFIWLSDQSNRCIIRYDGNRMTRYQNDPRNPNSLGGFYPECLFPDSSGNIWIGFYGMGLDKFDPVTRQFTHYRHNKNDPGSLSNDTVNALLVDHLGNTWVGTFGGLDLLNEKTGTFTHYRYKADDPSSLSSNIVRAIYEDRAGEIWVGTGFAFNPLSNEGGLNRFNRSTGKFTRYLHDPANPHSLINNKVRAIFEDSYGNFWVGTAGDGLHTMDRKTGLFTRHGYNPSRQDQLSRTPTMGDYDHITFITEDTDRTIWIGTLMNGIIRYDPISKKINHYGSRDDHSRIFKDSSSWWAHASPDGNIWLSDQDDNLFRIDINNTVIPHFGGEARDRTLSVFEENDSIRWYGTLGGLIRENTKNKTKRRIKNEPGNPNSLDDSIAISVIKSRRGDFWIGTSKGLNQFDPKTNHFTRYFDKNNNYPDNAVVCVWEDPDSNIWAARWSNDTHGGGLQKLNPATGKITTYKNDPADASSISSNLVSVILEDQGSDLWLGTFANGGLNRMNRHTGRFTQYLQGLSINSLYRDAAGVIWIGTLGGLFRYDRKLDSVINISEENAGINIVQIASITGDKEDNLWIATYTGIYMLNKKRDQVTRFGKDNGLGEAYNTFNQNAAKTMRDGQLIFGNGNGYFAFYPEKLTRAVSKAHLYFTGFWLDNKELMPGKTKLLKNSLHNTKEIRLAHDQNVFSFSATYIDFRNAGENKIYYQLEGFDQGWHTTGSEERIQYFKIPPGEYNFRIKAADTGTGGWMEKSIAIIISPPWWNSWWAYCIYGALFFVAAFSLHRYQRGRVILAERERTRVKELAQAKEIEKAYNELKITQGQLIQSEKMASLGELTAGIAHEIQNPLNFVNNFAEVNAELIDELRQEADKGNIEGVRSLATDIQENEKKISHHGKRADAIVKSMLQHSQSAAGEKQPTDINALADEYLRLAFHGLRAKDSSFNASMKTDYDKSVGRIPVIPQDIGRVLLNLFNNAFYVVNEKKKILDGAYEPGISVSTRRTGTKVEISVKDNGSGIPQKLKDKIFQPFFTTKPTGQGTGLGLSLSYDIVKAHGGEIKVDSREGEGSDFIIQLPVS